MGQDQDEIAQARAALQAGNARAAFVTLRTVLENPARVESPADWDVTFKLFADIGAKIAGPDFESRVRKAAQRPDDLTVLYDLGWGLVEDDLCGIAATVLGRANRLRPGHEGILSELVEALERSMRHAEAVASLRAAPPGTVDGSFALRYLLAWNSAMIGDLDEVRRIRPTLDPKEDGNQRTMAERLDGLLARADAVRGTTPLDRGDLRGWQAVISGTLLLHLSPHGGDVMNGRYAYVQDSEARCLEAIRKVQAVLALVPPVPRIFSMIDGDSRALAIAMGRVLNVPVTRWPYKGTDDPGLIVSYDLEMSGREMVPSLQPHRPGQILWMHASRWVVDQPVAADLVTYLYQFNRAPWADPAADATSSSAKTLPPDRNDPDERADQILGASLDPDTEDATKTLALAKALGKVPEPHAIGLFRTGGTRRKQFAGGPVASSRFS